jgi:small subunit ribosomal protein S20
MPHRNSALKTLRQDAKRALRNKSVKSRLRTEQNKLDRMLERGEAEPAAEQLSLLVKLFHRAAAKGVIHANTAARRQSQYERRLNEIRASAAG